MTATLIETPGERVFRLTLDDNGVLHIEDSRNGWHGWKVESLNGFVEKRLGGTVESPTPKISDDRRSLFIEPGPVVGYNAYRFETDMWSGVVTLDIGLDTEVTYFFSRGYPPTEVKYE